MDVRRFGKKSWPSGSCQSRRDGDEKKSFSNDCALPSSRPKQRLGWVLHSRRCRDEEVAPGARRRAAKSQEIAVGSLGVNRSSPLSKWSVFGRFRVGPCFLFNQFAHGSPMAGLTKCRASCLVSGGWIAGKQRENKGKSPGLLWVWWLSPVYP